MVAMGETHRWNSRGLMTESAFTNEMESLYRRSGEAMGYWPHRFLRAVRTHGGLVYAKKLLAPGATSTGI